MIEKNISFYDLQCDYCSYCVGGLEDFQDAVDHKKANKWKSVNINGEWFDKCPSCQDKDMMQDG